jgi:hypothetical protein
MESKKDFHTLEHVVTDEATQTNSLEEFFSGEFAQVLKEQQEATEVPLERLSAMRQSPDDDETIEELPIIFPTKAEQDAGKVYATHGPHLRPENRQAQIIQLSPEEQASLKALAQSQGLIQEDEEAKSPSDDELPAVKKGGLWQWVVDAFKGE